MKQCNECSNRSCGLIHSTYPKFREDLPLKMQGKGDYDCYSHVPVQPIGKGLGYLREVYKEGR